MAVVAVGRVLKLIGEKFKINCQNYKQRATFSAFEFASMIRIVR
jgi:hypothetical protein